MMKHSQTQNMVNFNYRVPSANFDKKQVRGKLGSLFKVKDIKKFGVALESVVGGKMWSVVV